MTIRNYAVLYTFEWARLKSDNEACLPPLYTYTHARYHILQHLDQESKDGHIGPIYIWRCLEALNIWS